MSVPKAPVDEDASAVFPQHDVRFPGQSFAVDAIAESFAPQPFAHDDLRLRVFRPDCRHVVVTLLGSSVIAHLPTFFLSTPRKK